MSIKEIIMYPNPILKGVAKKTNEVEAQTIVQDLADTLYSSTGVGLSACQIGNDSSVLIYDPHRKGDERNYRVLMNPKIVLGEGEIISKEEGCKSLPWVRVDVPRYKKVLVEGCMLDGQIVQIEATDYDAVVLQHEIDHVNGKLIIDYVTDEKKEVCDWRSQNLVNIFKRIKWLKDKPEGVLYEQDSDYERIYVIKNQSQIQLYFADLGESADNMKISGIMSRIDLDDPLVLLGIYTQAMMLSLVWSDNPQKIYMLGYGGGRLPMIFHHYFSSVIIDGSEIDQNVLDVSEKYFGIAEDARIKIAAQDGRKHLADMASNVKYDIILIDCYAGSGHHPDELATVEFYETCKKHLEKGGVLSVNLIESDPLFIKKVYTLYKSFRQVYDFEFEQAHVFFGSDKIVPDSEFVLRANKIQENIEFEFPFAERANRTRPIRMYRYKPHTTDNDLLFDANLKTNSVPVSGKHDFSKESTLGNQVQNQKHRRRRR